MNHANLITAMPAFELDAEKLEQLSTCSCCGQKLPEEKLAEAIRAAKEAAETEFRQGVAGQKQREVFEKRNSLLFNDMSRILIPFAIAAIAAIASVVFVSIDAGVGPLDSVNGRTVGTPADIGAICCVLTFVLSLAAVHRLHSRIVRKLDTEFKKNNPELVQYMSSWESLEMMMSLSDFLEEARRKEGRQH